jgi:SNF2 family DNA or RNA helicase
VLNFLEIAMKWKDSDGFLETIKEENRFGIFLDMGVGKTALLLALADHKFFNSNVKKILIITPKKVSLSTWQNEIKKWSNFSYMSESVSLIEGTEQERIKLLQEDKKFCIHIISSSLTEWLGEGLYGKHYPVKPKYTPDYDMFIVDECSQFKSPKSLRYKALKRLSKDKMLFLLSGTPFSNIKREKDYYRNADELYYALYLLGIYDKSLTQFRNDFCFTTPWEKFSWKISTKNYDVLIQELAKKSIRKKLDMEIKMYEYPIFCELDKAKLNKLKKDYYLETNGLASITASNKAVMINKTLQLSNGFIYDDTGGTTRFNSFKYEKLLEVLSQIQGNSVIFYNFKEDKDFLLKNLKGAKAYEKDEDKENWNKGLIKYLILSPFSEKYGLNLQEGGNTIIWFGLVWSAESYQQSNARLYRRGQKNNVSVYYLMAAGSFDEYVYNQLVLKKEAIDDFISFAKVDQE